MALKFISILTALLIASCTYSQGHINHIKNQEYLRNKEKVDCNNLPGDNLSERICANLAFQKSDSLLVLIYDSLLNRTQGNIDDSLRFKLTNMQTTWRTLRDEHCAIIYDSYKNCGSCHVQAIAYLNCLRALTDDRIKELRKLYFQMEEQ
jgi:uncharacterized protein YecT (DUF1311 family)